MAVGDPLISTVTLQVYRTFDAGVTVGPVVNAAVSKVAVTNLSFSAEGAAQKRILLVSPFTDIQPTDDVLILSINGNPPRKAGPYEVEDVIEDGGSSGLGLLQLFLVGF